MPLPLKDVLKIQHRISQDDIGFTAIYHFLPKQEIGFLLLFENGEYFKKNLKYLKSSLLDVIARSNFIDRTTKNKCFISSSTNSLYLTIDIDEKNNLPFENIEHFEAFSKNVIHKFYGSGLKRIFLNVNNITDDSEIHKKIAATSFLADKFLKSIKGKDFYDTEFDSNWKNQASQSNVIFNANHLHTKKWPVKDYIDYVEAEYSPQQIHEYMQKLEAYKEDVSAKHLGVLLAKNNLD